MSCGEGLTPASFSRTTARSDCFQLKMEIREIDLIRANSVTENGYHRRKNHQATRFLATNLSFVNQCNVHHEIQKSLKRIDHTFTNGIEYKFRNCVTHNTWIFIMVGFFNYLPSYSLTISPLTPGLTRIDIFLLVLIHLPKLR
jgi:hypothetical protein